MSGAGFRDRFSAAAADYAAFRPTYPLELFDFVVALAPTRERCWDAGTGSGQAAVVLGEWFAHVIATDASRSQLAHAARHPRVTYHVALAEASGLPDASCDLVTAALALHWFDIPAFFSEVARVLKPGGAVACWGYAFPVLEDAACDGPFQRFCREADAWWPPERRILEAGYRGVALPFDEVPCPPMTMVREATRAAFTGYLRTWSSVLRWREAIGKDPAQGLDAELAAVWPAGRLVRARWTIHLRAGRKR